MPTTSERRLPPGERVVARTSLRVGALLAVPVVAFAGLQAGWSGAVLALVVIGLLAGGLAAVAWAVGRAAPHGPGAVTAAALGGSLVKLGVVAALLVSVPRHLVDPEVLAGTVLVALVVLLAAASWAVLRQPEAWWVEAGTSDDDGVSDVDDGRTTR